MPKTLNFPLTLSVAVAPPPGGARFVFLGFNGASLPKNGDGNLYPYPYISSTEGGPFTSSFNTTDSISGKSLQMTLTSGRLYAQFNPFNYAGNPNYPGGKGFARWYAENPAGWQLNTYNRMSFWVKMPPYAADMTTNGNSIHWNLGTYVKRVVNADMGSDETGGGHYYHHLNFPDTGTWTQVIINMHPNYYRGGSGDAEIGMQEHPTGEAQYNYFDTLTRFYLHQVYATNDSAPTSFLLDQIEFYTETRLENDKQIYSLLASYRAVDNRLVVSWNRDKTENAIKHEVRYAFVAVTDWNVATAAPAGIITPPGWNGYNNMVYDNKTLPLAGKSEVYVAIKPQNSALYTQIRVPLNVG